MFSEGMHVLYYFSILCEPENIDAKHQSLVWNPSILLDSQNFDKKVCTLRVYYTQSFTVTLTFG